MGQCGPRGTMWTFIFNVDLHIQCVLKSQTSYCPHLIQYTFKILHTFCWNIWPIYSEAKGIVRRTIGTTLCNFTMNKLRVKTYLDSITISRPRPEFQRLTVTQHSILFTALIISGIFCLFTLHNNYCIFVYFWAFQEVSLTVS